MKNITLNFISGAEPFFFSGGRVGCLCLHGLSASPQEVYWLGKHMAAAGFTVLGPRLFGHGTQAEDLYRARWRDWYYSALDGYHVLRQMCDTVFVMGLSMGGITTLKIAAEQDVAGAVVLGAPLRFGRSLAPAHYIKYFKPNMGKSNREDDPLHARILELQKQRGERVTGRAAYYRQEMNAVAELHKYTAEVATSLHKITAPVMLVYSPKDEIVPIENVKRIQMGLTRAAYVETLIVQNSGHILTNDVDHEQVFARVEAFVKKVVQDAGEKKTG